jgi:hypothetical protein
VRRTIRASEVYLLAFTTIAGPDNRIREASKQYDGAMTGREQRKAVGGSGTG